MELKKMDLTSASGSELNLEALYQIMPSAFTEVHDEKTGEITHKINFYTLRELLGDNAYEGADEEYGFKWVGKNAARREAARPINKTFRPCPEESVDWENTQNLYIEGDNLEVLKLLQKSYLGKVKMIYIDPPYNTGNDFVYVDNFDRSNYEENFANGNVDEFNNCYRRNSDSNARFHSDWCSMIYERLLVARSLLSEDGVIFISIGDAEVNNLHKLCNEIYGESNFIAKVVIITGANQAGDGVLIQKNIEYVLCYSKNITKATINRVDKTEESWRNLNDAPTSLITRPDMGYTIYYNPTTQEMVPIYDYDKTKISTNDESLIYSTDTNLISKGFVPVRPGKRNGSLHRWRWGMETFNERISEIKMFPSKGGTYIPKFMQGGFNPPKNYHNFSGGTSELKQLFGEKTPFDYPKGLAFLKYFVSIGSLNDSIILDFFSGSATTAHAVIKLNAEDGGNRKFIMVQLPEETESSSEAYKAGYKNICEIGKERIRRAGRKIKEESGLGAQNLDTGFRVFKCEDSFMNNVYFSPNDLSQADLFSQVSNIKDGTSDLSLLFGCMLDWGVELSLPLSSFEVSGKTIYNVNDGDLVACFAEDVNEEVIAAIAELSPLRVVFRDSCFSDAPLKMNLFELFKQKCGWSEEIIKNRVQVI